MVFILTERSWSAEHRDYLPFFSSFNAWSLALDDPNISQLVHEHCDLFHDRSQTETNSKFVGGIDYFLWTRP